MKLGLSHKSRRGLTLVEMLVVVGILTLLAAVLLPVLWQARNRARDRACASNLREIGRAALMYAEDFDGSFPYAPTGPKAGSLFGFIQANPQDPVSKYINGLALDVRQSLMPSGSTYVRVLLSLNQKINSDALFRCPNDSGAADFGYKKSTVYEEALCSYIWDPGSTANTEAEEAAVESANGQSEDSLSNPSSVKLWQDYGATWHQVRRRSQSGSAWETIGRVNAVFADGHTASTDMAVITKPNSGSALLSAKREYQINQ